MTLDDLEHQYKGFIWAATHILRANCAEITTVRPRQRSVTFWTIRCTGQ